MSLTFLTLGALSRIIIFQKEIIKDDLLYIVLFGILGGALGGFLVGKIPDKYLIIVFLITGAKYIYDFFFKIKKEISLNTKNHFLSLFFTGTIASLFSAFGLPGGSIRQGYYFSRGYTLQQVQGTAAVIFFTSGLFSILSRLYFENLGLEKIYLILPLFLPMLLVMYFAKKVSYKIPKIWQDRIIIYSLVVSLLSVIPKLF